MKKHRILIADNDCSYAMSLQLRFIQGFLNKIDLEIITDKEYFDSIFSKPNNMDVLIVTENWYSVDLHKHEIAHLFILTDSTAIDSSLHEGYFIFKYSSINEIYSQVITRTNLKTMDLTSEGTKIILVTSPFGGAGKTTLAFGLCDIYAKQYKRVLYLNAETLNTFQYLFSDSSIIQDEFVYGKLLSNTQFSYQNIRNYIRTDGFDYLPAFKLSLASFKLRKDIYLHIAKEAKKTGNYDYIIIDSDSSFDDEKIRMMELADKVVIVSNNDRISVKITEIFLSNIGRFQMDKYVIVNNKRNREKREDTDMLESSFIFDVTIEPFEKNPLTSHEQFYRTKGLQALAMMLE